MTVSLITMFKSLLILIWSNLVSSKLVWLVSFCRRLLLFSYQLSSLHSACPTFTDPIRILSCLISGYSIRSDLELSDLEMSDLVRLKYTNPDLNKSDLPLSKQSLSASNRLSHPTSYWFSADRSIPGRYNSLNLHVDSQPLVSDCRLAPLPIWFWPS